MWPHLSEILSALTELRVTGNKPFIWKEEHQKAFDQMKALIAKDTLL